MTCTQGNNDIALSKNLSLILRHKANEEGLSINEEGYIKVYDILNHRYFKGKYTVEDIKRVVLSNDKKRFTLRFNSEVLEICANQGHSISGIEKLNLLPITETQPYNIIHGTYYRNWEKIKTEGISRMKRNHIHFAKSLPGNETVISGIRKNCQVYIYINLQLALDEGIVFYKSTNEVLLSPGNEKGIIEPKYFLKCAFFPEIGSIKNQIYTMNNLEDESNKNGSQIFICDSCNMQFPNRKMFEIHKKMQNHIINEKVHGSKGDLTYNQRSGIYVRGYPEKTKENDLVKYFSQFGNVIWAHFGHDFLLLDFTEQSAVEKVMAKNAHFLHGRRLVVRHKEVRNNKVPINDEEVNEKIYQSIISDLQNLDNFDNEFLCMARKLQPNVSESFKKYNLICQDLYNFLYSRFPNIQVHPFGSTLTGLGFNNSDIDVFLSNVRQTEEDEINCLNIIKRLLNKSNRFGNCFVIPGAKIPIVKCVHRCTGIRCDINIKNMLGVCNSKLIHYYLSIDIKVKQALIVLKYWGKCHKITGQNHLLTNYSLAMIFIFFLQQAPYNFPSVLSLQQPEYELFSNIQDCWNGGFVPNYNFHSDKLTSAPLVEILEQFFAFYSEFPYQTEIICPYLGRSLPKTYFKVLAELPDSYKRYKEHMAIEENSRFPLKVDTSMCLQDPFEHCRNTTGVITMSVLEKFIIMCELGQKICSERKHVLYKLLTEQPPSLKKPKYNYQDNFLEMSIHKGASIKYKNNTTKLADKKPTRDQWFDSLVNFITVALRDFLQLALTYIDDEDISPSKNSKNEGQTDVHDSNKIIFSCAGKTNMWHARKATAKQLNLSYVNSTLMERETAITAHLKEIYKNFQDTTDILSFKITIANKQDEALVSVEKITAYKKSFKSFAMFFAANIPLWFEMYEKEMSKTTVEPKK